MIDKIDKFSFQFYFTMIVKHFAVIALVAIVAHQVLSETAVNDSEFEFRGLADSAQKSLNKLKKKLEGLIDESESKLNKLVDNVKQKGQEIIDNAQAKIHKDSEHLLEEIEKIEADARASGVEVNFEYQKNQIKEIEQKSIAQLLECVAAKVEEFTQIVKNIINKILNTIEFYAGVQDQINNCKAGSNKVICIIRVIGEIIDKTLTLPVYILTQVAKAATLVTNFVADITACATRNKMYFSEEANQILTNTRGYVLNHM